MATCGSTEGLYDAEGPQVGQLLLQSLLLV